MTTTKIFTEEMELQLRDTITEEFIQASKNIFADVHKITQEKECVPAHKQERHILKLKKTIVNINAKLENKEDLMDYEKKAVTTYSGYVNLICSLYTIAASRHIALNPNAVTINAIHNFALISAKRHAYIIFKNHIESSLENYF